MYIALITGLGVGSATVLGAVIGLFLKKIPHKFNDIILSFAAGVMLAAAVVGLILPSIDENNVHSIWITALGVICGAFFLNIINKFTPHMHTIVGLDKSNHTKETNAMLLFILAIAIHNFPEGIAAGVSFGSDNINNAISVSVGIALQNIPEGMIVIVPMISAGIKPMRAFLIAAFTGVIEVVGTMVGYFAVSISAMILPFALAFAGGTMLYIISDEMIPETHSHGYEHSATYSLLIGFIIMLIINNYIG